MREVKRFASGNGRNGRLTREQVTHLLTTLLNEICGIEEASITEDASLEDLQIESVQLAQIQVAFEEDLDIEIDFLEVFRLRTFGRIVDYIYSLVQ